MQLVCYIEVVWIHSKPQRWIKYYYIPEYIYGPSANAPTNSTEVRSLEFRVLTVVQIHLILLAGTTFAIFTVALPSTLSLSSVIDLDALNANITSSYVLSTFNVND
jgi:hypothetical protein